MNGINIYSIPKTVLLWRDYPTRTSKILDDYSRKNFWKVRALHLPKFIEQFTRYKSVIIFGVGSNGKTLCRALQKNNYYPRAFADINPARIGQKVQSIPVLDYKEFDSYRNDYILRLKKKGSL